MASGQKITLIKGDGIGVECIDATQKIIDATGVNLDWQECEAGAEVFKKGVASGVPQETLESIKETRIVLKGPLETPVGFGEKSANVTLRKLFETYANIRPVKEFPGVPSPFEGRGIDFVIIRENVEDLYAGIEYMQTPGTSECLKLITRKGCEKICRLAFEFARSEGRKTVHCATKANIMKFSEGMMKKTFEEVAKDYPEIEAHHIIVDNCAHQLVRFPEKFETIVTTNMNGDILSDLGSGLVGGLGFAPSANLGSDISIFEAVHGSAPKYAGKNVINPSSVLLAGVMMLRHIGHFEQAQTIEQALLATLEQGIRTQDVCGEEGAVTTSQFTDAIIGNFGKTSNAWDKRDYDKIILPEVSKAPDLVKAKNRKTVGIDVFIEASTSAEELGADLKALSADSAFELKTISNRGVQVYPATGTHPDVVDHWPSRFMLKDSSAEVTNDNVCDLLKRVGAKYRWMHTEVLNVFDGDNGFSKAQGED